MLTQNLFNKKPKTFMDYEPGKLPNNKDWDTQTKSETKNYAPFASNVKIVGNNVTKKDYDDFFEGFNDPYGEKREQEQQRKERLANIRANADKQNRYSQSASTLQTDAFVKGFNKEKTTGILNPHPPYDTDRAFGLLGTEESELKSTLQKLNASPAITNAINRNPNAKSEYKPIGTHDPNEEPVITQLSNDEKTSDFTEVLGNTLKRSFFEAFAPDYLKPSRHTALWFVGAETYLKHKGYDTSAWLLKHSLQPNPEDVYRDDNSRIAQLIKNDPAFVKELDIAIANSDGKTLDKTISVSFKQGDLYYSIHKNDIKLTGYKDENGKWKISARLSDEYNFSELTSWMDGEDATLGTLANDVAYFSEKIGAITPYNIYVDFNIER